MASVELAGNELLPLLCPTSLFLNLTLSVSYFTQLCDFCVTPIRPRASRGQTLLPVHVSMLSVQLAPAALHLFT